MPDNGEMPDNQGMATEGLMNVYPPPPGRSPGTIDGHWGDAPPPRPLGHDGNYGKGAFDAAMDARHGVLKRIFDGIPEAKENARKTIRELFEHGGDHEHESHTAVMAEEKTSSARHLPEDESLTDRVLAVCGRR
jgi:hypothetical protein